MCKGINLSKKETWTCAFYLVVKKKKKKKKVILEIYIYTSSPFSCSWDSCGWQSQTFKASHALYSAHSSIFSVCSWRRFVIRTELPSMTHPFPFVQWELRCLTWQYRLHIDCVGRCVGHSRCESASIWTHGISHSAVILLINSCVMGIMFKVLL